MAVVAALRTVFRARAWYLSVLVLAATPAWFLHSRTAFETAEMTAFYALFILCYLLYRTRSPGYIFPALVFAAAAFYSYSNEAIIGVLALALAVVDVPYHWRVLRRTEGERGERERGDHLPIFPSPFPSSPLHCPGRAAGLALHPLSDESIRPTPPTTCARSTPTGSAT